MELTKVRKKSSTSYQIAIKEDASYVRESIDDASDHIDDRIPHIVPKKESEGSDQVLANLAITASKVVID
jgi:5-methylcytosine-specific restriction endonuclease McrA